MSKPTILVGKRLCFKRYVKKEEEKKTNNTNQTNENLKLKCESTKDNELEELAKKKLISDAKRVSELSHKIGIAAAIKKPKIENKLFLANVIRQAHFSNESKRVKRINKTKT